MGTTLVCRSFPQCPVDDLRERVQSSISLAGYEKGSSYSGYWAEKIGVHVSSREFTDPDEARTFIDQTSDKFSDQLCAVKVYKTDTKSLNKLVGEIQGLNKKLNQLRFDAPAVVFRTALARVKQQKSALKRCHACGSRIAITHLSKAGCPVCGSKDFLLTATEKRKLEALRAKAETVEKKRVDLTERHKALSGQAAKRSNDWYWLVGGNCRQ